ncbi:hypothetical protein BGZ68_005230 [Mortierella alpina]|nr:hypothetical protein BGZ68_005230 [Mortierella alpina]
MSKKSGSFTLQPVVIEDAAPLAQIGANSFVNDRNTLVKDLGNDPYKLEKVLQDPLGLYLSIPHKIQCIKAVDNETGERMGYVYWGFRGWAPEDIPTLHGKGVPKPDSAKPASTDEKKKEEEEEEKKAIESPAVVEKKEQDPIKRLIALTDKDMDEWCEKLMPEGCKCMFVVSLSVDPKFHGRGVGSALMRWGTAAADEAGVYMWVHSSESAHTFYAKEGFEVVGILDVDLDEYALAPPPPEHDTMNGKWGHYVFRYMKRLPNKRTA